MRDNGLSNTELALEEISFLEIKLMQLNDEISAIKQDITISRKEMLVDRSLFCKRSELTTAKQCNIQLISDIEAFMDDAGETAIKSLTEYKKRLKDAETLLESDNHNLDTDISRYKAQVEFYTTAIVKIELLIKNMFHIDLEAEYV